MMFSKNSLKLFLIVCFAPLIALLFMAFGLQVVSARVSTYNTPSDFLGIGTPRGMVMADNGNIWYVDSQNTRLVQFDPSLNTISRVLGRQGSLEGEFEGTLLSITKDNEGYLYVLDDACYVYKLDSNGGFVQSYDISDIPVDNGYCALPYDIHYDAYSNSIFVANGGWGDSGFVSIYPADFNVVGDVSYVGSDTPGSFNNGSGDGEFECPRNVTTDSNGRIYVSDECSDNRVQVFSSNNEYLFEMQNWDDVGGTTGFANVKGMTVLSNGTIFVNNQDYHTLEKFNSSGVHQATYDGGSVYPLSQPEFIIRDSANNIYVSEWNSNSIAKYNSSGVFQSVFSNHSFSNDKFYRPSDVIYGPDDHMFVLDGASYHNRGRIQEFSNTGTYIRTISVWNGDTLDTGVGSYSRSMTYGPDGKIYVSSAYDIRVFELVGDPANWVLDYKTTLGLSVGGFGRVDFDSAGNLYIPDFDQNKVIKAVIDTDSESDTYQQYIYSADIGGGWLGDGDGNPLDGELAFPLAVAIDSEDNVFVTDDISLKQYETNGTFVQTITRNNRYGWTSDDEIVNAQSVTVDPLTDEVYVSDWWGDKIVVYDNTGVWQRQFGTVGTGPMEFYRPYGLNFDPVTGLASIADQSNGRIQTYVSDSKKQIKNLIPSADVIRVDNGQSLVSRAWDESDFADAEAVPARLMFGDYLVAEFTVDLTADRDWVAVNMQTLPFSSTAMVSGLNTTDAPGISATHSLFVYRYANQTDVNICPLATTLEEVYDGCPSMFTLGDGGSNGGVDVTATVLYGKNYWQIDGLTGTGAFSTLFITEFQLRDQMTRLQADTASNHRIEFGTTYDLTHDADTIAITFGPEWDFATLAVSDIDLFRGSTSLTLAATEDVNTWGVSTTGNQLIFTAPTNSGSTQYISAGSVIVVVVTNEVIINPATIGSYELGIRMESSTVPGPADVEVGSVSVPIVDSDQVNVTSYINTFINFDIDTNITGADCDYNVCPPYEFGDNPGNYTVDFGELNSTYVNKSQIIDVWHADGGSGFINSIYFDLTTNAVNGATVSVVSSNSGLESAGVANNRIESVAADGDDIAANSGLYGFQMPSDPANTGNGTINTNTNCTGSMYCRLTTSQNEVFNTATLPLDNGRVRMDLAAAAAYTNNPGSYTDTLTFIAVPEY